MRYLQILITLAMVAVSNYTFAQGCGQPVPIPIDDTTGSCGTAGQDLVIDTLSMENLSGTTLLDQGTAISSSRFTTTASTSGTGTAILGEFPGSTAATRHIWVSACPGGPALGSSCDASGFEPGVALTKDQSARRACVLDTSTTYYLNYQSTNCSGNSCKMVRQFY